MSSQSYNAQNNISTVENFDKHKHKNKKQKTKLSLSQSISQVSQWHTHSVNHSKNAQSNVNFQQEFIIVFS